MSVSAWLSLHFTHDARADILASLLDAGWNGKPGEWLVMIGDDDFDWQPVPGADRAWLESLLRTRAVAGQVFGVSLWWNGGDEGGDFVFFDERALHFSPAIDRVKLNERMTDVSWYLPKIFEALPASDVVAVERWTWEETA